MKRVIAWSAALAAVLALLTPPARAERVPSSKVQIEPQHGTKPDIRVPYTTNGNQNLGVAQGVAPRIYSSPVVNDALNPQARPVFNLVFYGAIQSYGGASNGAMPRPTEFPLSR
jgi:hypothetical protein